MRTIKKKCLNMRKLKTVKDRKYEENGGRNETKRR
jgi:hypothetical protein